jgi:CRP-like cAMP-binding protein
MRARVFNPGEQVFLQGDRTPDFFGLVRGRFAKIKTRTSPRDIGLTQALSQAELVEVLERPNSVFGEIDVFLQQPHDCSVFAIDPGEIVFLPPDEDALCRTLEAVPVFGVQTCISFAHRLWQKLQYFSRLNQEEPAIDRFIASSVGHYQAISRDLTALTSPNQEHSLVRLARSHPTHDLPVATESGASGKGSSVYSAVIRPPGDSSRVQLFSQGSLLCKRDTLGDRLFILVEGVIEIPLGNDTVIQIARPGSVIGEIAVFLNLASRIPNVKRTADCICATTVKAIVLDLDQVEPYLGEHPQLLTDLLIAMTERTKETHSLIAMARNRLREKLFSRLNLPLLGFNQLAHALESYSTNLAFAKPFTFCAYQARQIFNRFKESLAILDSPV